MIPLAVPNLRGNEARYLQECIDTNFVSSVGPFVDRFEASVSEVSGAKGGVAVASGTSGLHAALVALEVRRDDLVILPSLTFIASANAVAQCGADPWLFDVTDESWTLDPDLVERALRSECRRQGSDVVHAATGRRVAAMMPVHTLGTPADMDRLVAIADAYGIAVVADGAASLGASYRGRPMGRTGAQLTVFSFNGNKTITCGGGGMIVGDDERLVQRVRHLTTTARSGPDYHHDRIAFNYRMTNLQAAVGCAQLERLDSFVAAKRRIARRYEAVLCDLPGVGRFPRPSWADGACWLAGITLDESRASALMPALRERGIDARPFWKPVHLQPPHANAPRTELPVCERVWPTVLTLPCSTSLTPAEQETVIEAVRTCLAGDAP